MTPESTNDLTNVHKALHEATLESEAKASPNTKNFSVRMPEPLKLLAMTICERHATDLSTFLRKCTEGLVSDYGADVEKLGE